MNERTAIATVEKTHGSLDDFVLHMLEKCPKALDENLSIGKRAASVNLPTGIFSRILASPQFRQMMRTDMVNRAYNLDAERTHVHAVVKVAKGDFRVVATARGEVVEVDQNPADVMAAGKYLNEARGTPMESRGSGGGGVIINIGNPGQPVTMEVRDDGRTLESAPQSHQRARAGGLPPAGVLGRSRPTALSRAESDAAGGASLGTLYGPTATEADEDHRLAQKVAGSARDGGLDAALPATETVPLGYEERAERWRTHASRPRPDPSPTPKSARDD